jgi:adenylate cyclase
MAEKVSDVPEERRIAFRVGLHVGDIIIDDDDIFGDGVNIAARLQEVAPPGGVCVSDRVYRDVRGRLEAEFTDSGEQALKNIAEPVRVWRWTATSLARATVPPESGQDQPPETLPDWHKPSIAVLAFDNLNGDREQEYFSDGITEDIISALSQFHELAVIARSSTFTFKGKATDVREVARQLRVRYVVEGSVRRGGERVRITAQLIDAASGKHLWADRYDRMLDDIISVQEDISREIVARIAPEIRRAEHRRVGRLPPHAMHAYDLAMQADALIQTVLDAKDATTPEQEVTVAERAVTLAESAVAADPTSPSAFCALAKANCALVERLHFRPERATALDKAAAAAEVLRELDPFDYAAYLVTGQVCIRRRQSREALINLQRAHELNPNNFEVLAYLGWAEFNLGLTTEARQHCKLALRLSPRDVGRHLAYWNLAWSAFVAGEPADGVQWARKAIEDYPSHYSSRAILAACLSECGDDESAQAAIAYLVRHRPDYIRSRLEGNNYLDLSEVSRRFTTALRKAAGSLLVELGLAANRDL